MTKIVVDTNVWVAAAFNPHSSSARIVKGLRQHRWRMMWNDFTYAESKTIVEKIPPLRHRDQWEKYRSLFREDDEYTGEVQPDEYHPVPDDADRHFAAVAGATGAVLVTSDNDFLDHKHDLDIYVVTPGQFCEEFACPQ